jgi:RHS repeat-associated protein
VNHSAQPLPDDFGAAFCANALRRAMALSQDVPTVGYTNGQEPYDQAGEGVCTSCESSPGAWPEGPYYYPERVLIHMPDGSTHEFRKSGSIVYSNGSPALSGVYVAVDGSRMRYDAAGYLLKDTWTDTVTTAINRGYDADGHRVRRVANGVETWLVYGLGGELIAEYAPTASQSSPQKESGYRAGERLIVTDTNPNTGATAVEWVISDHLGSTRAAVNQTGLLSAVTRHDYLPYGEELQAGVSGRSAALGHGVGDGIRQKFTGYERDTESGLDFAQARYYASVQGRFTSPDPLISSSIRTGPQSLNRYAYVGNRPTVSGSSKSLWHNLWL